MSDIRNNNLLAPLEFANSFTKGWKAPPMTSTPFQIFAEHLQRLPTSYVSALCDCLWIEMHVPFVIVNTRTKALEDYIVSPRGYGNIWQRFVWVCFTVNRRVDRHRPTGVNTMDFVIVNKNANILRICGASQRNSTMLHTGTLMSPSIWRVWRGRRCASMFRRRFGFDSSCRGTKYIYIGGCENFLRRKGAKVRGWNNWCALSRGIGNGCVNGCAMRGHGPCNLRELCEFRRDIELQVEIPASMPPGLSIRRVWYWRDRYARGWQGFIRISWESCLIRILLLYHHHSIGDFSVLVQNHLDHLKMPHQRGTTLTFVIDFLTHLRQDVAEPWALVAHHPTLGKRLSQ